MNKVYLPLFIVVYFFCKAAYADNFYLKVEAPVITRSIKEKPNKYKGAPLNNTRAHQTFDSYPMFGIGYNISDYIEAELMYGQLKYSFEKYETKAGINYFVSEVKHDLFAFAHRSSAKPKRSASCGSLEYTFLTRPEICGTDATATANTALLNIRAFSKIQTLISSIKLKPFKQINFFTPYISVGAGIATSKSNYTYSADVLGPYGMKSSFLKGKKSTNALALEFGIGVKIKLTDKVSLEMSSKYFNYGKHSIAHNISKSLNGYKLNTAIIVDF